MPDDDSLGFSVEQPDRSAVARGFAVVKLSGRLGSETAGEFDDAWAVLLERGIHAVALDMSGVEFVGSSGLRSILAFAKSLSARGGLALFGMRPSVAKVFQYSGFDRILPIRPTLGEARKCLRFGTSRRVDDTTM